MVGGDEASDGLDRHQSHPLVHSSAGRSHAKRMAIAVDLHGHHRRNHHPTASTRCLRRHQNLNPRRHLLGPRRPHPLAHCARLLLHPRLHKNRHRYDP
ncbi:dicarboxylate transporter 1 [Actinidia rufa]|uniref:Dicarboxylate transporter 1 n=1 Tax=Actinidia rufa TaxID=165716 RepID=A0A7J0GSZ9_9ERIC|nr:dicarboxylate transporter 1 [Actinidia rufa]